MMKRILSVWLAALLILGAWLPALAEIPDDMEITEEGSEETETVPTPTPEPYVYEGEFVVGNPTPMDGKFFTGMWGNATSDIDVRTLVNSYFLTLWGYDTGLFRENRAVVSGMVMQEDPEGNRVYTFALYDDLYYSDGTPITAWDYAFSILFQVDPVIAELGGLPLEASYIDGVSEYIAGEAKAISGVRVITDHLFTITVKHEYLPYFFELYRVGFLPYPIHEIAPGCKVYDDGEGVYIGNEDPSVKEPLFTKELLQVTVMDPEEGYLSHPTVGSGPYVLTSWDGKECTFEINPYFKGNELGYKPTIPKLRYKLAVNEDMIEKLQEGEFQLLNKVTRGDTILKGIQAMGSGPISLSNYPRIGLTFLVFTPDRPALQQKNVRQAIDYCFDKEKITQEYTNSFGLQMDGLIGLGQWMYEMVMGSLPYPIEVTENPTRAQQKAYEEEVEAWDALNLDNVKHYELNVEKAIQLLEEAGWTLNAAGEPFDPEKDDVRYGMVDGELVGLDLTCAYPETNVTAKSMEDLFIPYLAEAGIRLTLIPMDMKTLLRSYNDRDIEEIDMFYLGDDFNIEFDPQLFFLPGETPREEREEEDTMAWAHAEMFDMAYEMTRTEPHAVLEFMQKWIAFQEELSDLVPLVPVYSNVYFDFYTSQLRNYDILYYVTWGDAIVPSYMVSPEEAAGLIGGEEEEAGEEAGEEEFGEEDSGDGDEEEFEKFE